jgi:hypothetical protein
LYFNFRPRPSVRARTNDQMLFGLTSSPYFLSSSAFDTSIARFPEILDRGQFPPH